VEVLAAFVLLSNDTIEAGLLPAPLDDGLCCHESVPERARLEALRAGTAEDALESCVCAGLCVADVFDVVLLPLLLNPLNSGTSSAAGCDEGGSIVDGVDAGGVTGGCELLAVDVVEGASAPRGVALVLTGLIDFERSA
jgi:hypothetical protein